MANAQSHKILLRKGQEKQTRAPIGVLVCLVHIICFHSNMEEMVFIKFKV